MSQISLDFLFPTVYLALSRQRFENLMKGFEIEPEEDWILRGSNATVHNFTVKGKAVSVVCIQDNCPKVEFAALLVHEAAHIKQDVMDRMREDLPSKEFEAYLMQAICHDLFLQADRQKKLFSKGAL